MRVFHRRFANGFGVRKGKMWASYLPSNKMLASISHRFNHLILPALIVFVLSGCGGGGDEFSARLQPSVSSGVGAESLDERKVALANSLTELSDEQALAYTASYSDLTAAFGTDVALAKAHYAGAGRAEGRVISFSALRYIASYPDLIGVFGLDTETATRQYIRRGLSQGRTASFDGLRYIATNLPLLSHLGLDADAAARHYITVGYSAGLRTTFSPLQYIASFADLMAAYGLNAVAGVTHYIANGFSESRRATFNAVQYLANYADLRAAFGTNTDAAAAHFISNGSKEGRTDALPNGAPTARISTPASNIILIASTINLSGASSSDPDGNALTYLWKLTNKPANSTAQLGGATTASPALSPDVGGSYVIELVVSDGTLSSPAVSLEIKAGTPVSGNLLASMVWTKANSPIIFTGDVGIPYGATLNIKEGVELVTSATPTRLFIRGALIVEGSAAEKVRLSNLEIIAVGESAKRHSINISNAVIQNSTLQSFGSGTSPGYGDIVIRDSWLDLRSSTYLSMIEGSQGTIERNYFQRGALRFNMYSSALTIKNNSFGGLGSEGDPPIRPEYVGSNSILSIVGNTFRAIGQTSVALRVNSIATISVVGNYWSTLDDAVIQNMIFDQNDDLGTPSTIQYQPFLTAPDPATPLQ